MKVESEKINDCRVKLVISASADETRADYNKIVVAYKSRARIRGFRAGKAPLSVIQQVYGKELAHDVRTALLSRFCREALEHEKLNAAQLVEVENVVFAPESGVSFVAFFDLNPEVKLPKYHKLAIKYNKVAVSDAELEEAITTLRCRVSPRVETDEAAVDYDQVRISFTATSGKQPLDEVVPGVAQYAKNDRIHLDVGVDNPYLPGFGKALIGKKAGDTFDLDVKFPKDFGVEALRGIKAEYHISVVTVTRPKLVDDETLAQRNGVESFEKLRERAREMLEQEASIAEDERVRNEIRDYICKKTDFALPDSVVEVYAHNVMQELAQGHPELMEESDSRQVSALIKKAKERAAERVRISYVCEAIAKAENIELPEGELQRAIDNAAHYMARQSGRKSVDVGAFRAQLENSGRISFVKRDLLTTKVIDWLLSEIKTA